MKRHVYHVVLKGDVWHVRRVRAQRSSSCHAGKSSAIARAKALAKRPGRFGQVLVHARNGKIQTEWTYGGDPRKSPG